MSVEQHVHTSDSGFQTLVEIWEDGVVTVCTRENSLDMWSTTITCEKVE